MVFCTNNDSVWHRFRDIIRLAVYVTGCDLESPSCLKRQLKLQASCAFKLMCKYTAVTGVRKVSNSKSDL